MTRNRTIKPTAESIFEEYDKGRDFNARINLDRTVEVNENFFIGKQWEDVTTNGLPTPVFNFLKRIVLFQVASILSDKIKMVASPLTMAAQKKLVEQMSEIVTNEFEALFEYNKLGNLLREYMRNAAVDGDGCLYTYWDDEAETGQPYKGAIRTEIIENTRVFFGNPNERSVQHQPYIIIESRELLDSVRARAEDNGASDIDAIKPDVEYSASTVANMADNRVTVLLRLWKDDNGEVWACETVKNQIIRKPWNMKIRLYPVTWLNWDYVQDCYHGEAMITGLIPNQIFVNKTYAMVQLSLMQSAFPKIVYDKTRISKWTNQAGVAIGVNGGDMGQVARIIEPAPVSPQIAQFIQSTIDYTQTFLGGTSAALGDARPDNTSAIIALQRASAVPSEITKQNLYQSVEDLGQIYLEFMTAYYGKRSVKAPMPNLEGLNIQMPKNVDIAIDFDFGTLRNYPMILKLDVGASSYWSEIASMRTLDNLLMSGHISVIQYLERIPSGYIQDKEGLIADIQKDKAASTQKQSPLGGSPLDLSALGAGLPTMPMNMGAANTAPPAMPLNLGGLEQKVVQGK